LKLFQKRPSLSRGSHLLRISGGFCLAGSGHRICNVSLEVAFVSEVALSHATLACNLAVQAGALWVICLNARRFCRLVLKYYAAMQRILALPAQSAATLPDMRISLRPNLTYEMGLPCLAPGFVCVPCGL
jgi:hypothetical protein